MGARFDGINTSTDATTAAECYKKMGYRSSYSTSPTYAEFSGSANGSKRVESDILFISGHGREDGKRIRVKETGVITGNTGNGFIGVNNVNWNTSKLVVYAGCLTALESEKNNLTVATYNKGADTVLGWHQSINADAHTIWLRRFNNSLANGATFSGAFKYASSFTDYTDNRVKDLGVYGNWNTTYSNVVQKSKLANENEQVQLKISEKIEFTEKNQNIKDIISLIKNKNPNFNENDYKVEIYKLNSNDNFYTIDFIRQIDGFNTNSGYNVAVEFGKVTDIFDRTIEVDESTINMKKITIQEEKTYLEKATNDAIIKARSERINKMSSNSVNIKEQLANYYYDINTNKKYYKVFTTIVDSDGDIHVAEFSKEL